MIGIIIFSNTYSSHLFSVQPRVATFAAQGITMAHYMEGASYTKGPTQNISIRVSSMLRNFGGEVLCDATVEVSSWISGCIANAYSVAPHLEFVTTVANHH